MKKIKTVSDSVYPGPCSAFLSGAMNKKNVIVQKKRVKRKMKVIVIGRKGIRTNTSECYLKYEDE